MGPASCERVQPSRAFTQQKMSGPINNDVPGAGLLHQLTFKLEKS